METAEVTRAIIVGDPVKLNSGGPRMTVTRISDSGLATCSYFDRKPIRNEDGVTYTLVLKELHFPLEALVPDVGE